MSIAHSLVRATGKLPFTGRHGVRRNITEGVRAARRGDGERVAFYANNIGSMAVANTCIGVAISAIAAVNAYQGMRTGSVIADTEAVYDGIAAMGYAISAASQYVLRSDLQRRAEGLPTEVQPLVADHPASSQPQPSALEHVVTTGSKFGAALTLGHTMARAF
ncbi:MAG TPA: hypothetical protein VLI54_04170 [Bacillota bacterium]|nr:hypothetical protein [Bacillota bacterium]